MQRVLSGMCLFVIILNFDHLRQSISAWTKSNNIFFLSLVSSNLFQLLGVCHLCKRNFDEKFANKGRYAELIQNWKKTKLTALSTFFFFGPPEQDHIQLLFLFLQPLFSICTSLLIIFSSVPSMKAGLYSVACLA